MLNHTLTFLERYTEEYRDKETLWLQLILTYFRKKIYGQTNKYGVSVW